MRSGYVLQNAARFCPVRSRNRVCWRTCCLDGAFSARVYRNLRCRRLLPRRPDRSQRARTRIGGSVGWNYTCPCAGGSHTSRAGAQSISGYHDGIQKKLTRNGVQRTLAAQERAMTIAAVPFSSCHKMSAAAASCASVMVWLTPAPSLIASCAGEFAWRRPSWGVYNHQATAKKRVHMVERT